MTNGRSVPQTSWNTGRSAKKRIYKLQAAATLVLLSFVSLANAQTVCPAVGQDTTCGTIITVIDTGATISNTGQGPYDGIEDTLVGVVNNSSMPISALGLSGPGVYGDQSYPFYYDPSGELNGRETATTLSFFDAPANPCLAGGDGSLCGGKTAPKGQALAFTTHLVGIKKSDGTAVSGGVAMTKSNGPVDPGSGTGGVTIVSNQETSNYGGLVVTSVNGAPIGQPQTLESGVTCNGVYSGNFNGNITVSAGQRCTFVNGSISGNVQQTGGALVLSDSLIDGNVQINGGGTFALSAHTEIEGNLQVQNLPASGTVNQICDTTVLHNFQFQNNGASMQIGSLNPAMCGGNVVAGNMEIHNNAGSSAIIDNTVSGNLDEHNNMGATQVTGNSVVKNLQCHNNVAITGSGNSAGRKQGQCKTL